MIHFLVHLAFMAAGAIFSGMFVDYRWKTAIKKLLDKITSLQEGITSKQGEINGLNVNLISANSNIKMLTTSLLEKEKEFLEIKAKVIQPVKKELSFPVSMSTATDNLVTTQQSSTKKRGPYKKKKYYGKPTTNNDSVKKAE